MTLLRRGPHPRGIIEVSPVAIRSLCLSGRERAEVSAQKTRSFNTGRKTRRCTRGSHPGDIPKVSPGPRHCAPPSPHRCTSVSMGGGVYPGWYRRSMYRKVYTCHTHQGTYTGIPPYPPGCIYGIPPYPPWYTGCMRNRSPPWYTGCLRRGLSSSHGTRAVCAEVSLSHGTRAVCAEYTSPMVHGLSAQSTPPTMVHGLYAPRYGSHPKGEGR